MRLLEHTLLHILELRLASNSQPSSWSSFLGAAIPGVSHQASLSFGWSISSFCKGGYLDLVPEVSWFNSYFWRQGQSSSDHPCFHSSAYQHIQSAALTTSAAMVSSGMSLEKFLLLFLKLNVPLATFSFRVLSHFYYEIYKSIEYINMHTYISKDRNLFVWCVCTCVCLRTQGQRLRGCPFLSLSALTRGLPLTLELGQWLMSPSDTPASNPESAGITKAGSHTPAFTMGTGHD